MHFRNIPTLKFGAKIRRCKVKNEKIRTSLLKKLEQAS
jgi:hypothetical protein